MSAPRLPAARFLRAGLLAFAAAVVIVCPASASAAAGIGDPPTAAPKRSASKPARANAATVRPPAAKSAAPRVPRTGITDWPTGEKLIALTYDDGPSAKFTPKFLDLFEAKKAQATFFMCGNRIAESPAIAKRAHDAGFELANHSYTHPFLPKKSEAEVRSELAMTNERITAITGKPVGLMRPPYGAHNAMVDAVCRELGLKIVIWDIDTEDWKKRGKDQMVANVLKNARDGSIVLFHDRLQPTLEASEVLIDELRARGFTLVTAGDLLSRPRLLKGATPAAAAAAAPAVSARPSAPVPAPVPDR